MPRTGRRSIIVDPSSSPSPPVAGVASIIDAMEEQGLQGLITGSDRVIAQRRFHGPAATLRMAAADLDRPTREHWQWFDQSAAGSVLVIATGGADFTVLGGVSASVAAARGVAGIVTDGAIRDIDEVRTTHLPVRFSHRNPRSCAGEFHVLATDQPIRLGGQRITPGDYLVSDADGLVVIPAHLTHAVLATAAQIERRETAWARIGAAHKSIATGYAHTHPPAATAGTKEK